MTLVKLITLASSSSSIPLDARFSSMTLDARFLYSIPISFSRGGPTRCKIQLLVTSRTGIKEYD